MTTACYDVLIGDNKHSWHKNKLLPLSIRYNRCRGSLAILLIEWVIAVEQMSNDYYDARLKEASIDNHNSQKIPLRNLTLLTSSNNYRINIWPSYSFSGSTVSLLDWKSNGICWWISLVIIYCSDVANKVGHPFTIFIWLYLNQKQPSQQKIVLIIRFISNKVVNELMSHVIQASINNDNWLCFFICMAQIPLLTWHII